MNGIGIIFDDIVFSFHLTLVITANFVVEV